MTKVKHSKLSTLLLGMALLSPSLSFAEQGDFIVRGRVLGVLPTDDSGQISLNGAALPNTGVGVDEAATLELDLTYMVTNNIGIEVIAGTANHTVELEGAGLLTDGLEIFDTYVLPPTVTAQWHFMPDSNIRPYIGAGINYTMFLSENATNSLESAVGPVSVNMDSSLGFAAQAGVDIDISDRFFANFDVKYIDIDSTAKLKTALGQLQVDVDIDPIVVGVGVGMRF